MTTAQRARDIPRAGARALNESLLLSALILLATALRLPLWLARHPLHHDEALYGFWAQLIASGRDPWLLTSWVDKPPLVPYLQAAAMWLFGPSEVALRLPGMIAGILTVPLFYGFARRAYDREIALVASTLLVLCAFAIQFSPTAFTDPWLVLFMLAACWAALAGRSFLAGLAVGLAVASKQQGMLVFPLVMALMALHQTQSEGRFRPITFVAYMLLPALFGFGLIFVPVTYWDSLRWAKRPSFWDRSLTTYGGLHLAEISLWPERMAAWSQPLRYLFGPPAITILVAGLAAVAGAASLRRNGAAMDRILTAYVVWFLALHVVITFQPWDRYLLPLTPLVALLAARGLSLTLSALPSALFHRGRVGGRELGLAAVSLALAWGAMSGALGRLPVGSDHGAYAGVDRLATALRALPPDDALYYRSLGWHYDFYLFDAPQERRWWGSVWKLSSDAAKFSVTEPHRGQWVVLPPADSGAAENLRFALATRAMALSEPQPLPMKDGQAAWLYRIQPASLP